MIKSALVEVEIPTSLSKARCERNLGRFLKGPIPLPDISQAARLGGRALAVFLAVHHQVTISRKRTVTLPKALLAELGIDKDAKARAIRLLEEAGLLLVQRVPGTGVRVSLSTSANVNDASEAGRKYAFTN